VFIVGQLAKKQNKNWLNGVISQRHYSATVNSSVFQSYLLWSVVPLIPCWKIFFICQNAEFISSACFFSFLFFFFIFFTDYG